MSTISLTYKFNTAITGVNEETGKFDEAKHREAVLPLRGRLLQHDGLTGNGLQIDRYEMTINYVPEVTNPEAIDAVVDEAVAWAAEQEGFFPLRRGKHLKTPKATRVLPYQRPPSDNTVVYIDFHTNIVHYPIGDEKEGWDEAAFRQATKPLADRMIDFDGVRSWQLRLATASITFAKKATNAEAVIAHLRQVFQDFRSEEHFFPYLGEDETLDLTFEVKDAAI
jgi:hypothetical protein